MSLKVYKSAISNFKTRDAKLGILVDHVIFNFHTNYFTTENF